MEYHLVYLTDQTKSSSAFRMFFKFVCPDFCETKNLFPHPKMSLQTQKFLYKKRGEDRSGRNGSSSNTKRSAKALLEHSSTGGHSLRVETTKIRKSLVLFDIKHSLGGGSQTKTERMALMYSLFTHVS